MTFKYELDPYSLQIHGCANMNYPRQGFRKLSSDRQTDLTDTTEIIHHAASREVKKFEAVKLKLGQRTSANAAIVRITVKINFFSDYYSPRRT